MRYPVLLSARTKPACECMRKPYDFARDGTVPSSGARKTGDNCLSDSGLGVTDPVGIPTPIREEPLCDHQLDARWRVRVDLS